MIWGIFSTGKVCTLKIFLLIVSGLCLCMFERFNLKLTHFNILILGTFGVYHCRKLCFHCHRRLYQFHYCHRCIAYIIISPWSSPSPPNITNVSASTIFIIITTIIIMLNAHLSTVSVKSVTASMTLYQYSDPLFIWGHFNSARHLPKGASKHVFGLGFPGYSTNP